MLRRFSAVVTTAVALWASAASAQMAPDAQVKAVTAEVTAALKADPTIPQNPTKLATIIETKLAPNFNFTRMTQLAMGRNWAKATPEQQKALTAEFKNLLVRTYSGALANYRNHTVDVRPLRMQPTDTEVVVRTVVQQSGSPVQIDYSMEKVGDGWRAYDVVVGGVSLVTNYREEFNNIIRDHGIDGLIKSLQQKNKS